MGDWLDSSDTDDLEGRASVGIISTQKHGKNNQFLFCISRSDPSPPCWEAAASSRCRCEPPQLRGRQKRARAAQEARRVSKENWRLRLGKHVPKHSLCRLKPLHVGSWVNMPYMQCLGLNLLKWHPKQSILAVSSGTRVPIVQTYLLGRSLHGGPGLQVLTHPHVL